MTTHQDIEFWTLQMEAGTLVDALCPSRFASKWGLDQLGMLPEPYTINIPRVVYGTASHIIFVYEFKSQVNHDNFSGPICLRCGRLQ
ncbi:hypothetical protein CHS0354_003281, partial [Potamilus streckersoni]